MRTIPEINHDISKLTDNIRFNELLLTAEWIAKSIQHELDKIQQANKFIEFLHQSQAKAPSEIIRLKALLLNVEEELLTARQALAEQNLRRTTRTPTAKPAVSKLLEGVDTQELILQCIMQQHQISREMAVSMLEQGKVGQL